MSSDGDKIHLLLCNLAQSVCYIFEIMMGWIANITYSSTVTSQFSLSAPL